MSKASIDFKGFDEIRAKLNRLGANTEQIAIEALEKTNDLVYNAAKAAIQKPNLPAQGHYSGGQTERALREKPVIEINGTEVIAHVGFDISKGGLASIMLMRGTPSMPKVQALYDAFFGQEAEIDQVQREVFERAVERYMG